MRYYLKILLFIFIFLAHNNVVFAYEKLNNEAVNNLLSILKNPDQTKDLIKILENVNEPKPNPADTASEPENNKNITKSPVKKDTFLTNSVAQFVDYFYGLVNDIKILLSYIFPIMYVFIVLIGMMIGSEIIYTLLKKNFDKKLKIMNLTPDDEMAKYSLKYIVYLFLRYVGYSFISVSISSVIVFIVTLIVSSFIVINADIWFPIFLFAIVFPLFKIVMHVTGLPLGESINTIYHKKDVRLSRLYYSLCYLFYALLVAIVEITSYDLGYFLRTIIVGLWIIVSFYILKSIDYAYNETSVFQNILHEDNKNSYGFIYKLFYRLSLLVITISGVFYIVQADITSYIFVPNKLLYCMLCIILTMSIYNIVVRIIALHIDNRNKFLSNFLSNQKNFLKLQPKLSFDSYVLGISFLLMIVLFVLIGLNLDLILHIFLLDNVITFINTSSGRYLFNLIIPFFIVMILLLVIKEVINSLLVRIYSDKEKLNNYLSIIVLLYRPYIVAVIIVYGSLVSYFAGASFSALLASTGMLTLVVTLGFKDIIASFVRVIMNILSGGFRVNDSVIISGQEGIVEDISIVYVKVRWSNGNLSLIPTSSIGLIVAKNESVSVTRLDFVASNQCSYDDVVADITAITNSMYQDKKAMSVLYKGNMRIIGITNYTADKMTVGVDLYYKTGKELDAKSLYFKYLKKLTQTEGALKTITI